jgi:hypothetical protein
MQSLKVEVLEQEPVRHQPFGTDTDFGIEIVEQASSAVGSAIAAVHRHAITVCLTSAALFGGYLLIANSSGDIREIRGKSLELAGGVLGLGSLSFAGWRFIQKEVERGKD